MSNPKARPSISKWVLAFLASVAVFLTFSVRVFCIEQYGSENLTELGFYILNGAPCAFGFFGMVHFGAIIERILS